MSNPFDSFLEDRSATDKTLIRRFRGGEQDAASEIYLRYAKRLRGMTQRQTSQDLTVRKGSDDIIQSVFRTFFRRVSNGQYDVVDGEDLWRLFLVIALNKIRSAAEYHHANKRDVRRTKSIDADLYRTGSGNDGDDHVALLILKMTIDDVLAQLPDRNREIVRLRIDGFSVLEISKQTVRAQRSVERVLQEFRQLLLNQIEGCDEA